MVKSNHPIPPDILERIDPAAFSVPDLIGLVLVERGTAMTLEEIAKRLEDLGVLRSVPSLRKGWHALHCLRKNREGKLELIREEDEYAPWKYLELRVYLHLRDAAPTSHVAPGTDTRPIDDVSPVALEELLRLPASHFPLTLSLRRRLALLAEACGGEVQVERAIQLLEQAGMRMTLNDVRYSVGSSGPVRFDADGKLVVHPDESLQAARRILRERLRERALAEERDRKAEENFREWQSRRAAENEEMRRWYDQTRKAVLRCLFAGEEFGAACVLEPDTRTFQDFLSPKELAARLQDVEVLLGIDPRGDLDRLGVEPGKRRFVDLSPPTKTVKLNRRGRMLRVTPELIIRSSLGISRPLGVPSGLKKDLREGKPGKVFRRLRADLKALWRLYQYGCLHGAVRIEWGFLREWRGVTWNVGRLPRIEDVIEEAREKRQLLEAVLGRTAPGWEDPWSRAVRFRVAEYDRKRWAQWLVAEFPQRGERERIPFEEVAAIRRCP